MKSILASPTPEIPDFAAFSDVELVGMAPVIIGATILQIGYIDETLFDKSQSSPNESLGTAQTEVPSLSTLQQIEGTGSLIGLMVVGSISFAAISSRIRKRAALRRFRSLNVA